MEWVAVGLNDQRTGLDGRAYPAMTSMRTFEALAGSKPLLAAHSDADARLGLGHGEHLAVVRTAQETLDWTDRMLGDWDRRMPLAARRFVLEHHTYERRLATIAKTIGTGNTVRMCPSPRRVSAAPVRTQYDEEVADADARFDALDLHPSVRSRARELAREHDNSNMRYPELLALAGAMLTFRWATGQTICEIGTFHGITAAFLGRLADLALLSCHVLSVDSFESPYLAHFSSSASPYFETLAKYGLLARRNSVISMRSAPAAAYVPSGIGLLLVDGGHDYTTVIEDLASYVPKVASGGAVAVDDVWYESVRGACDDFPWAAHGCSRELALEKIEIYRRGPD